MEDGKKPTEDVDASKLKTKTDIDTDDDAEIDVKSKVSYETHRKLLDEKKKLALKLKELEDKEKKKTEEEIRAKEDYKKLIELRENELKEIKEKYEKVESRLANGTKLSSFFEQIDGKIDKQYWPLIDLDSIAIDPDTGLPDEMSVKKAAKDFAKTYPDIIKKEGMSKKMPNGAAKGGDAEISYEEWKMLPYDKKRERMKDVKIPSDI